MNSLTLPYEATKEEAITYIANLKVRALNLIATQLNHNDARYLEPKELKLLVDTTLSIEDSLHSTQTEGSQARTVQRLLDKYGSRDAASLSAHTNSRPSYTDAVIVTSTEEEAR